MVLCGISTCFQVLSPCLGQIVHALLTRPPLESRALSRRTPSSIPARLACVKHAASVRPEPGSNSYVQSFSHSSGSPSELAKVPRFTQSHERLLSQNLTVLSLIYFFRCIVFKDRVPALLATTLISIPAVSENVKRFLQVYMEITKHRYFSSYKM